MNEEKKLKLAGSYMAGIVNNEGCFDLQFRKDVKSKRTKQPVYYRWKAQFVISSRINKEELLQEIRNSFNCGRIHYITGTNLRYSVQDTDSLFNVIVPFFKKYPLSGNKKLDFELWAEAVQIIYQNKGNPLAEWPQKAFSRLIEIQKIIQKYKAKKLPSFKWLATAELILKTLKPS